MASKTDAHGRAYATVAEIKAGDILEPDDGFDCMLCGDVLTVQDDGNQLYVPCSQGRHFLDGQVGVDTDDGTVFYIGLYKVTKP